jgi:hypothetical protein
MIIYNPLNNQLEKERVIEAEAILDSIPAMHCFITGSFLFKKEYNDIDLFTITRRVIKINNKNKKINLTKLDFNDLHSLFYHSISKSCISKNILPTRSLKITISDYWQVINEAIPTLLNGKNKYHKNIRFLILYTEYFKSGSILDTFQLNQFISNFKSYKEILNYVNTEIPHVINKKSENSYIKRFFYTQSGFYKDSLEYESQNFLYRLTHLIIKGM